MIYSRSIGPTWNQSDTVPACMLTLVRAYLPISCMFCVFKVKGNCAQLRFKVTTHACGSHNII